MIEKIQQGNLMERYTTFIGKSITSASYQAIKLMMDTDIHVA